MRRPVRCSCYTDGLIERRGSASTSACSSVDASTGLVGCAGRIADALVERCAHDHTTDDIALLVAA
jgi:hypothetical protein